MSFFNPYSHPLSCEFRLELVGVSNRDVILRQNGKPVHTVQTGEQPVELLLPRLELAPGVNCFVLHSPAAAKRLSTGRYQLRTFGLKASSIRIHPGSRPGDWSD